MVNTKRKANWIDLTNKKFGKLTAIKVVDYVHRMCVWECVCECGNITRVRAQKLREKRIISCGCVWKGSRKNKSCRWKGYEEIGSRFWTTIKRGCDRKWRKIGFEITIEDGWNLFVLQNRKCALTGLELKFASDSFSLDGTASLDRIDSSKDYTLDNIQWVHKYINLMKWEFDQDYFINMCRLVSGFDPGLIKPISDYTIDISHSKCWKGWGEISGAWWCRKTLDSRLNKKITLDINIKQAWNLYLQQGGKCTLTGLDINFKKKENMASIDRIDSCVGYTIDNIQWLHKNVNKMKQNLSQEEFIRFCGLVVQHTRDPGV